MKQLWRIRHKETGLFYRPYPGTYYAPKKSNLSVNGKWYSRRPTLKHISHGYHHAGVFHSDSAHHWEIVTYNVVEA